MQPPTPVREFPALILSAAGVGARGAFAEAQREFFDPDPEELESLRSRLKRAEAGLLAHYYMDPELQGLIFGCDWPHLRVSDSLAMADAAIEMAEAGARRVVVLGVDFMSENVRAMLDAAGHEEVEVYRCAEPAIGCSLAESAQGPEYAAWLSAAAQKQGPALHVVYINTSLETKAQAHARVPTITCTSSNVVQTVLQAAAQNPELRICFGPDTYMGGNLAKMFERYATLDERTIRALHPAHDAASLRKLSTKFDYFRQGNCVVHHMFGAQVVARVRELYPQAHIAAHLEVPGEMFELALEASHEGRGVVGSTSDLLRYVQKLAEEGEAGATYQVVLGTEAGMVTAIVRAAREVLARRGAQAPVLEIVFPVAQEAVATTQDPSLPLVPGVAGGEGCTTAGGCATCPFMKMNSVEALSDLLDRLADGDQPKGFFPRTYGDQIQGRSIAALGSEPILHMRSFTRSGQIPAPLVQLG